MRYEAEQFEFNLMEENTRLKKENRLLRDKTSAEDELREAVHELLLLFEAVKLYRHRR